MIRSAKPFNLYLPSNMIWPRMLALFLVYLGHSELQIGGGYGAVFFLTLSGYIFTRSILQLEAQSLQVSLSNFIYKRFTKIFPALTVLVLLSIFAKLALQRPVDFLQVTSVFTFMNNYYNAYYGHPNNGLAHLWTLSVTIQYSALYILLLNSLNTKKNMSYFLILLALFCLGYRSLLVTMSWGSDAYLYNSLETRIDALAIGSLMGLNIELICEHRSWTWLKHPVTFFLNCIAIYFIGKFPTDWRNGLGFSIQAILYCLLIYQVLNTKMFIISVSSHKTLGLLCSLHLRIKLKRDLK